ncbi:MAG: calcium-binding protein [Planctomycetes bacterium]|nr:calcium-binding protein [Planctomycetota bacterium]
MRKRTKSPAKPKIAKRRLAELIEAATVDCYNDSEAKTGFLTMIDDHLAMPFTTTVLGAEVEVVAVDLPDDESVVAVCRRGKARQRIPILDLPLPSPPPAGSEWIEAYHAWLKGGW